MRRQRPEFLGGCNVRLFPLRGRHGKPVFAAVYEAMRYDSASPVRKDELEVVLYCNCKKLDVLVLDGSGAVLGDSMSENVWMEKDAIRVASRSSYDVLQLLCDGRQVHASPEVPVIAGQEVRRIAESKMGRSFTGKATGHWD